MLQLDSPCKVNLVLNILGRRPDGFHELETVMQPVPLCDQIQIDSVTAGLRLTCSDPNLPVDGTNLVYRAAMSFLAAARLDAGLSIHLKKRIPMAAGLGGGSGNAATTLIGLNEFFQRPLSSHQLQELAADLGSDVPFFLQSQPAIATGRGERVESVPSFPALSGTGLLLIHPGFGISTPWAYQQLSRFPEALNGRPGRAREVVDLLCAGKLEVAATQFYNSLEAPALEKYPILALYQEFLREQGALGALMSGSGSTTFALVENIRSGRVLEQRFLSKFGPCWTSVVSL